MQMCLPHVILGLQPDELLPQLDQSWISAFATFTYADICGCLRDLQLLAAVLANNGCLSESSAGRFMVKNAQYRCLEHHKWHDEGDL